MTENQMRWKDPRDQSMHEIRVRADLHGDVRGRQRQLGRVWTSMKELLSKKGFWNQSVRMGANWYRNEFYFLEDDGIWISVSRNGGSSQPHDMHGDGPASSALRLRPGRDRPHASPAK
eukprot:6312319-Pyramimonas_sp.AAC.1